MSGTRLITAEELLAMGEGRCELVRGEVVELTPAGGRHSRVALAVGRRLAAFVDSKRLGVAYGADAGFLLARDPDTVRAPDAAFVAAERMEGLDDTGYVPLAPDLVVEVVSPGDTFRAVEEKAQMWLTHGARLVWVVEPELRQVLVYRPGGSREVLSEADQITGEDVLPGFAVPVRDCM